jgi:hypothetical protein
MFKFPDNDPVIATPGFTRSAAQKEDGLLRIGALYVAYHRVLVPMGEDG